MPVQKICLPHFSHIIRGLAIVTSIAVAVFYCPFSNAAENRTDQTTRTSRELVSDLLLKLDSGSFSERELASKELAKLGGQAIEPLAFHSFECSPETVWRIKKTLESICTTGDREVFFKAIGILQLRFDSGEADGPMSQRLAQLEQEWRAKRKQVAIKKLEDKGAVIEDPWKDRRVAGMGFPPMLGGLGGIAGTTVISIEGVAYELVDGELRPITPKSKRRLQRSSTVLSEKAQRQKIKTILTSSVEENEELVFGKKTKSKKESASENARITPMGGRLLQRNRTPGILVKIPKSWKGTNKDISDLNDLTDISDLTLVGQELDESAFELLDSLTQLSSLTIKDCELGSDDLPTLNSGTQIKEITFSEQQVPSELIESFRTATSVQSLNLDRCDFESETVLAIKKLGSLRGLNFTRMLVKKEHFESLAKLNRLSFVTMYRCRFSAPHYEALVAQRPTLQVEFSGQALLGVHGRSDVGLGSSNFQETTGSIITQVVAGSAADAAGMKPGDIIQKVDDTKISNFDDLRLRIAEHQAGDRLTFQVQRGEKLVALKVKLAMADEMESE
ncbi:MAG: PDZ domain-containing protein [Mariniblastus sp.]